MGWVRENCAVDCSDYGDEYSRRYTCPIRSDSIHRFYHNESVDLRFAYIFEDNFGAIINTRRCFFFWSRKHTKFITNQKNLRDARKIFAQKTRCGSKNITRIKKFHHESKKVRYESKKLARRSENFCLKNSLQIKKHNAKQKISSRIKKVRYESKKLARRSENFCLKNSLRIKKHNANQKSSTWIKKFHHESKKFVTNQKNLRDARKIFVQKTRCESKNFITTQKISSQIKKSARRSADFCLKNARRPNNFMRVRDAHK